MALKMASLLELHFPSIWRWRKELAHCWRWSNKMSHPSSQQRSSVNNDQRRIASNLATTYHIIKRRNRYVPRKAQLISNINASMAVADVVRTTLGPRGLDKLIHDDRGNTTISNDGATIMKLLDIVHPAPKILVDIAKSQDSEGTAMTLLDVRIGVLQEQFTITQSSLCRLIIMLIQRINETYANKFREANGLEPADPVNGVDDSGLKLYEEAVGGVKKGRLPGRPNEKWSKKSGHVSSLDY